MNNEVMVFTPEGNKMNVYRFIKRYKDYEVLEYEFASEQSAVNAAWMYNKGTRDTIVRIDVLTGAGWVTVKYIP